MVAKRDLLRHVPLFKDCSGRDISRIAARATEHVVRAGEVLTREGAPGHQFFIVAEGQARVSLRGRKLRDVGPRGYFGEMALLDQGPRAATVVAQTDMRLYVLEAHEFTSLLRSTPAMAIRMLGTMSGRLREALEAPRAKRRDLATL